MSFIASRGHKRFLEIEGARILKEAERIFDKLQKEFLLILLFIDILQS
jgi:hypothetical protein